MKIKNNKTHEPGTYVNRIKELGRVFDEKSFQDLYELSVGEESDMFWADCASELVWDQPYTSVSKLSADARDWFVDGSVNYHRSIFTPERINDEAIVFYTKEGVREACSYAELEKQVKKVAYFLHSTGVRPGSTLCLATENRRIGAIYSLACLSLGVRFCFSYFRLPNAVLRQQIQTLLVETLIIEQAIRPEQSPLILDDISSLKHIFTIGPASDDLQAMVPVSTLPNIDNLELPPNTWQPYSWPAEATTLYGFTSGTTATPKAIPLGTARHYVVGLTTHYLFFYTERRKILFVMDFAWGIASIPCFFAPLLAGETVVIDENFFVPGAPRTFKTIGLENIGSSFIPITLLEADHSQTTGTYDFLKVILGGMKLNQQALDGCAHLFNNPKLAVYFGYGSSELGGLGFFQIAQNNSQVEKFEKLRPAFGVRYCIDPNPPNNVGVLKIHASLPSICGAIYNSTGLYQDLWSSDGMWFNTDDIAIDHGQTITLVGRADHMIKVKGRFLDVNLYEQSITEIIKRPSKLLDIATAGSAQKIVLFVEGARKEVLINKINEIVVEVFGTYALPHDVYFVATMPRTVSHKISSAELMRIYAQRTK